MVQQWLEFFIIARDLLRDARAARWADKAFRDFIPDPDGLAHDLQEVFEDVTSDDVQLCIAWDEGDGKVRWIAPNDPS
jgi:hypothetical protein